MNHVTRKQKVAQFKPLTFAIQHHDDNTNGPFSRSHGIENILTDDKSVYCSAKPININILLRYEDTIQSNFFLRHFSIKVPIQHYTSPLYDGLLFVSSTPIRASDTVEFDDYNGSKWSQYMSNPSRFNTAKVRPCCYFRIPPPWKLPDPDGYLRYTLSKPVQGRYILIKLLHGIKAINIDVEYVSFEGWTGKQAFASQQVR